MFARPDSPWAVMWDQMSGPGMRVYWMSVEALEAKYEVWTTVL